MFFCHPELWGRWTDFDEHIFQMCWNHQPVKLHPGRLTWNIIMKVWKIIFHIFLSKWMICRWTMLIFQGVYETLSLFRRRKSARRKPARKRMGTERLRRRDLRELEKLLKAGRTVTMEKNNPIRGSLWESTLLFKHNYISGISLNFEKVIIYKRPNQHIYDKFI